MSDGNINFDEVSTVLRDVTKRCCKWLEQSGDCDIQEALDRMSQMTVRAIDAAKLHELEKAAEDLAEAAAMAACVAICFKTLKKNIPPSEEMH